MIKRFLLSLLPAAIYLIVLLPGCVGGAGFPQTDTDADDEGDSGGDSDSDAGSDAPILDSDHDGWKEPNCWAAGCHTAADTHNSDMDPYECVECHGNNGTTSQHNQGQNCSDCHDNPADHPSISFPTNSCVACH
jgi:hypothetical protein